jgi:hypothetical protein
LAAMQSALESCCMEQCSLVPSVHWVLSWSRKPARLRRSNSSSGRCFLDMGNCVMCLQSTDLCVVASSSASMSLYWAAASRWAHVITVCFMCFRYMLHMFYLDVPK